MSKRRHNFGTKRFKEKSLFTFHARIALKSLILLFVRLIARGARIRKKHRQTDTQTERVLNSIQLLLSWGPNLGIDKKKKKKKKKKKERKGKRQQNSVHVNM